MALVTTLLCGECNRTRDYCQCPASIRASFGTKPAGACPPGFPRSPFPEHRVLTNEETLAILTNRQPLTFDEQTRRMHTTIKREDPELAAAFLAGIRFHQGYEQYGDTLFTMTHAQLEWAEDEEHADAFTYQWATHLTKDHA